MTMSLFTWLKERCGARHKATTLYRRGMSKAHNHDHQGAIRDYSMAIKMPDTPADVKAMALFNRALAYAAAKDESNAVGDLKRLMTMREAPAEVRMEAKRKLARMDRRSNSGSSRPI
jgi:hypothetical protein